MPKTNTDEIWRLIPSELRNEPSQAVLVELVANWNSRGERPMTLSQLSSAIRDRVEQALTGRTFGYETATWGKQRFEQLEQLGRNALGRGKRKTLRDDSIRILSMALGSQMWKAREASDENRRLIRDDQLVSLAILLEDAQVNADMAQAQTITPKHLLDSIFKWWTNIWPFCPPRD